MDSRFEDEIATGVRQRTLPIGGRMAEGQEFSYVLLEKPSEPVLMHWSAKRVPHYKTNCPNCDGSDDPKPFWYIGGIEQKLKGRFMIVELSEACFRTAEAESRQHGGFVGLVVKIGRGRFRYSQRVLRAEQRIQDVPSWPYQTRRELARTFHIPIRPRLFRAEEA